MKSLWLIPLVLACLAPPALSLEPGKTPFSADSAYANLDVLVRKIGPRPMGSPAEQRAMAFAVERFKQFGCQEAYVMPMTTAGGVNTRSGVAIGVLKGKTDRIILIGGHMDSAGPDIPGANDDGSGAATVIELARVLSKTQHESTLMFCCWGGEEEGLRGSTFFVSAFPKIDSVALMFQLDMVDGASTLDADPDGEYENSAPTWLVDATFDAFYNQLHHEGLVYPTQAATLNSSTAGATGSDHIPFLVKGIPAIDFTSDVTYPIHSQLDNWETFNPSGFARAGDVVYALVNKYDGGVPSRGTEKYWLVVFGNTPVAFPYVVLRTFAALAFLFGLFALWVLRRRRQVVDPAFKVRWSNLKLIVLTIIIQVFIWYSENIMGLLKGVRFPWAGQFPWYVLYGLSFGSIGLWLALQWARKLRLSTDPYVYYMPAFIIASAIMIALSLANAELPMYFALMIVFLAAGVLVRPVWLKAVFAVLMVLPLVRLVFFEYLGLFQRSMTANPAPSAFASLIYNLVFPGIYGLLSLPLVYALAAIYRSSEKDLFFLRWFSSKAGLAAAGLALLVFGVTAFLHDPYDATWKPAIRISQVATAGADSGSVTMASGEFLKGTRVSVNGRDTVIDANVTDAKLYAGPGAGIPWLSIEERTMVRSTPGDTLTSLEHTLILKNTRRPYVVTVAYRSDRKFGVTSQWTTGGRRTGKDTDTQKTFVFYSFPDSTLIIPATFAVRDTQVIRESIEVVYDAIAYPVTVHKEGTMVGVRSTASAARTFSAKTSEP